MGIEIFKLGAKNKKLEKENEKLKGHWMDTEKRCDELQAKLELAMSQNYCTMCGNNLDGYMPPKEKK